LVRAAATPLAGRSTSVTCPLRLPVQGLARPSGGVVLRLVR
jgi:hypothetical protein